MRDARQPLVDLLNQYRPSDQDDARQCQRLLRFVQEERDCFNRSLLKGHVTVSAWIMDETGQHALLAHHKKLNKWLQLGGHADGNADVLAVAHREAEEESGLKQIEVVSTKIFDVDIHLIPARKEEPEHFHYDIRFSFSAFKSEPLKVSSESHRLEWVHLNHIERYTTEKSIMRMKKKWQSCFQPRSDGSLTRE